MTILRTLTSVSFYLQHFPRVFLFFRFFLSHLSKARHRSDNDRPRRSVVSGSPRRMLIVRDPWQTGVLWTIQVEFCMLGQRTEAGLMIHLTSLVCYLARPGINHRSAPLSVQALADAIVFLRLCIRTYYMYNWTVGKERKKKQFRKTQTNLHVLGWKKNNRVCSMKKYWTDRSIRRIAPSVYANIDLHRELRDCVAFYINIDDTDTRAFCWKFARWFHIFLPPVISLSLAFVGNIDLARAR